MRRSAQLVLVGLLLVVLGGCSPSPTTDSFDLAEWHVEGPGQLDSGETSLMVTNSGSFQHTLVVTDSAGDVVAATDLIEPGESTELSLDLEPGRYSFTCRIVGQSPEGEIVDHFEAGMNQAVSVSG